jgi:hypothetical protein
MNEAWQGLEPEQPQPKRGAFYIALAAALFLIFAGCGLGFLVWQQRTDASTDPELAVPTSIVEATEAIEATEEGVTSTIAPAATATLPGNISILPSAEVVASRFATPPVIDGDGSEWSAQPVYSSPYVVFTHREWDGTEDLEATWQIAWDDNYLYLLATVVDDLHIQTQTGRTAYQGDSVELQIDTGRTGNFSPTLSPDDFQISLSPGDFANIFPSAWRFQGTSDGQMLDAPGTHNILVAAQRSQNGYILEAAIPWQDINLSPSVGLALGLAVNFNDNDTPGTARQEMMKSNASNRRYGDPGTWGSLRLE